MTIRDEMATFGDISYNPFATNPLLRLVANWRHSPGIIQKPEWAPDHPRFGDGIKLWMTPAIDSDEATARKLESAIYEIHVAGDRSSGLTPGQVLITEPTKLSVNGVIFWAVYIGTRDE